MTSQSAFRQSLLDGTQPVPDGLIDSKGRPAGRRYAVYRNNVAVSLREALVTGFPAVAKLIGTENFDKVAGLFLRQSPPESPLMMHYGAGFPEFLEGFEPLRHLGYLADVARLELAMRRSYHAADSSPMDPARLVNLEEDQLLAACLGIAPSVQVLQSKWPVLSVYRYVLDPTSPKPTPTPQDVIILRPELDPVPHALPQGGAAFVLALQAGQRFGEALEQAGDAFDLPALLGLLIPSNALTELTL